MPNLHKKSWMVSTLGGVGHAFNTAFDGVDYATKSLEISALNRTEMALIKKKKAMIEGTVYIRTVSSWEPSI